MGNTVNAGDFDDISDRAYSRELGENNMY